MLRIPLYLAYPRSNLIRNLEKITTECECGTTPNLFLNRVPSIFTTKYWGPSQQQDRLCPILPASAYLDILSYMDMMEKTISYLKLKEQEQCWTCLQYQQIFLPEILHLWDGQDNGDIQHLGLAWATEKRTCWRWGFWRASWKPVAFSF